jgi:hypothetical protein
MVRLLTAAKDTSIPREVHYAAIAQPSDSREFVSSLRTRVDTALAAFAEAARTGAAGTKIGTRKNQVWITVSKPPAQPAPANLDAIKDEVIRRWGVVGLLDLLKETDWLPGFHTEFSTIATREHIGPEELRKRLLLILFALGTNIGIKRIVPPATTTSPRPGGVAPGAASSAGTGCAGRSPRWWAPP